MADWLTDERKILSVKLAGSGQWYHSTAASSFERIERPGEYCMLPWIRVNDPQGRIIEAPLTQVELIEFRELVA